MAFACSPFRVETIFPVSPVYPFIQPVGVKYTPWLLLGGNFGLLPAVRMEDKFLGALKASLQPALRKAFRRGPSIPGTKGIDVYLGAGVTAASSLEALLGCDTSAMIRSSSKRLYPFSMNTLVRNSISP